MPVGDTSYTDDNTLIHNLNRLHILLQVQAIEAKAEIDRMAQHLSKVQRELADSKALHQAQVC